MRFDFGFWHEFVLYLKFENYYAFYYTLIVGICLLSPILIPWNSTELLFPEREEGGFDFLGNAVAVTDFGDSLVLGLFGKEARF